MAQHDFSAMTVTEVFALKDKYSKEGDLQALLEIALYRFGRGSIAMFKTIFPEICFLYGVMHRTDELEVFIEENKLIISLIPISYNNLAAEMAGIGYKYPNIDMSDYNYLDRMLADDDMHESFYLILKVSLSNFYEYRQDNDSV